MRVLVLNLIAFMISLASLHVTVNENINFYQDGTDQISATLHFDLETIRSPSSKRTFDLAGPIGASKTFITKLALELFQIVSFLHYLPVYALQRVKEYFLLI